MNIHQLIDKLCELRDETKWQEDAPTIVISDYEHELSIQEVFEDGGKIVLGVAEKSLIPKRQQQVS